MAGSANTKVGRLGRAVVGSTLIARITSWSVNPTQATNSEWGDSDSNGFTNRAPGRKDATADTEGKYDTSNEVFDLFQPEDIVILTLWLDNLTLYWDFPCALNLDFNLSVDVDSEEVIGWTANWGSDGPYFYPGEAGAAVRSLPA